MSGPVELAVEIEPRRTQAAGMPRCSLVSFAVVYLVLLAWIPSLISRLDPLTGDEPFYVMTSLSLMQDGDLDELNNYLDRDFDSFYPTFGPTRDGWQAYPDPLPPHATQSDRPGLYSKHGLGMALLVAVPWQLGWRPLTLAVFAMIAGLITANMTLLARMFGASPVLATVLAVSLSLTSPLLTFSLLIFPEMTAALCIIYGVRRLLEPRNEWWQWLLIGAAAAALPWLHYRLAPISVVLALVAIVLFRRTNRPVDWAIAASLPLISAALLVRWYTYLYGTPLPPSSDHAGFSGPLGTLNGLAGTFFDQQWGAFIHSPLLFLAAACVVPFAVRERVAGLVLATVVLPYLFLISAYRVWWGEWNPPARYLTDIVPLAAAPLGWWLSRIGFRARAIALTAVMLPSVAVSATFLSDPQLMYNQPDGTSRLLETWSGWLEHDLTGFIPSYVFYSLSPAGDRAIFATLVVALLAVALGLVEGRIVVSGHDRSGRTASARGGDILPRP